MSLNLVSEQLLAANGLKHQDLFAILGQLAERRLDYGDLYFQSSSRPHAEVINTTWSKPDSVSMENITPEDARSERTIR